ncbi:4-hydroxythreonine-4-phosphate dehydrogenase PdxA [Candidiatus Paracoxiella cheracis]|uniref:4-hydroxythreonine-4-phosphate dehydrogenase PdxA n=1 Tax=Candidiatus Paracoxiella cheracis TaxID=3405120 RepID=UPI003BF5BABF
MKAIVITSGEPAGVGPDILLKLSQHITPTPVVGIIDRDLLAQRAKLLGINASFPDYNPNTTHRPPFSIKHLPLKVACESGKPNIANTTYVIDMIKQAVQGCLDHQFSALVTAPVNKAIINEAGIDFSGHTELLTQLTNTDQSVMLMVNQRLRVALLTTHIPLTAVPHAITAEKLTRCLEIIDTDLKSKFKIKRPRILVCGLNPHAGENGHLGREEITIITPTLEKLRARGFELIGPVAADTAFTASRLHNVDVVLTMYHDQGLPVIKSQGFGETVNTTLGLPIIRTSVDHGTAFELAGTGKADDSSLLAAVKLAMDLAS